MKNILFYGGSSLLANMWVNVIIGEKKIFLTEHNQKLKSKGVTIIKINKTSFKDVNKILKKYKIDILINCVGLTNIEICEKHKKKSDYLNSKIPVILAKSCGSSGVKFIHISTDHLFDGKKTNYIESDIPNPLNNYAKSKLEGEKKVLSENKNALIIRTNFFGNGPSHRFSFSDLIINNLKQNRNVHLFTDVFYTPIIIDELVRITNKLIENKKSGIYNVVSNEMLSKYDFGIMLATYLDLPKGLVKKSSLRKREDLVRRPLNMSLSCKKVEKELNLKILPLKEQIKFCKTL